MSTIGSRNETSTRTVSSLLDQHRSNDSTRRRELRLLLAETLNRSEAWVLAHDDHPVPDDRIVVFEALANRRESREPVAYLLGRREFYGRTFAVDRRVLIPRPETEHLIERALELELPDRAVVLDLGTGSGCIAITLACERPQWQIIATDISLAALVVARDNARRLGVHDRVHFVAADLLTGLRSSRFDLVVSNPPYVELSSAPGLVRDVRDFEPHLALFPEAGSPPLLDSCGDGLLAYRRLFSGEWSMAAGTPVLLEIGWGQGGAVERLAIDAGFSLVAIHRDLADVPRVVELTTGTRPARETELAHGTELASCERDLTGGS